MARGAVGARAARASWQAEAAGRQPPGCLRGASGGESVITTSRARKAGQEHPMESAQVTRVLIVANRTASTPHLIEEVGRRANASPCEFALLIPDATNRKAADWTLETAQRSLRRAARGKVEGLVGGADPFESVKEAVRDGNFDEIIISTLSKQTSKWLRRDLIRRVEGLGLPVTAIVPKRATPSREDQLLEGLSGGGIP